MVGAAVLQCRALCRQRLGIEFPLAQAAPAGTVKQLPSPDTGDSGDTLETEDTLDTVDIADTLDTEDTMDTTETANTLDTENSVDSVDSLDTLDSVDTVDSVDTNTTEVTEPSCDSAVSNTVQLATAGDSAEYEEEIVSGSVRCVRKMVMLERVEWEEEVECQHGAEQLCYTSLVTSYSPHQQQECGEDYIKVTTLTRAGNEGSQSLHFHSMLYKSAKMLIYVISEP